MDYRLPGSSVHEILQVRILEWVAMPSPPGNISNPGTESVSLIPPALADGFFITSATWETLNILFSSVAQSYLTLQPNRLQHTRLPCPSPTSRAYSNSCPLSQWCHPTISSSVVLNLSQRQSLYKWVSCSHQVAKVLEFQLQHSSFQLIFRTDFL